MKDIMGMMKKVGEMQARMKECKKNLPAPKSTASRAAALCASRSMARAKSSASASIRALMKPDDAEIVEDLIVAAATDARAKADAAMQEKMAEVTGGLPLPPGMKLF